MQEDSELVTALTFTCKQTTSPCLSKDTHQNLLNYFSNLSSVKPSPYTTSSMKSFLISLYRLIAALSALPLLLQQYYLEEWELAYAKCLPCAGNILVTFT